MSSSGNRQAVVIGGGLAGLAAAEALAIRDHSDPASAALPPCQVTLVEPSGRYGGVVETVRRDGWLIERSADNFLAARPEAVDLANRLGLGGELIGVEPAARRALVLHRGRPLPVPPGFRLLAPGRLSGILATPLLTPRGKIRVLAERWVPARDRGVADESLESFTVRRLGREAFERLVQPLAAGIWTADPARLSMAAACPEFFAMELGAGSLWAGERTRLASASAAAMASGARYGQFLTLASGMETLPRRLAERLADRGVRFVQAAAVTVGPLPGGRWRVSLGGHAPREAGSAAGAGHGLEPFPTALEADAVVVAVPSAAAARLVEGCDRELAAELAAIEYAGAGIVSLGFSRSDVAQPLDAAGLVVPRCEGRRILAVSFSSRKFPGRAPEGTVLMRTFVGGALDPRATALDDAGLVHLVRAELRDVLGVRGEPLITQVDRWHDAMPQYHLGHAERVSRIGSLAGRHPGLGLAGAAYEGVGIPQVIASGRKAAQAALAAITGAGLSTRP